MKVLIIPDKVRSLIYNEYIYSISTRLFMILLTFVQSVIIARFYGTVLKGETAYIVSLASILSVIITFGMHQAYPFFKKKYKDRCIIKYYINSVYYVFFVYFFLGLFIIFLSSCKFEYAIGFVIALLMGYSNIMGYVFLIETPNRRNKILSIVTLMSVAIIIALYFINVINIYVAVFGVSVIEILKSLAFTWCLRIKIEINDFSLRLIKDILAYGFFPMLALLLTSLNQNISVLILKEYTNISYSDIGVFSVGMSVADKISLLPDTLAGILASRLSRGRKENEVVNVSRLCFVSSIIMSILIVVCGRWFISILFGNDYSNAYRVLIICSLGTIFCGHYKLIAQYNIVNNMQIVNVVILFIAISINISFCIWLIPKWGIYGASVAIGIANLLCGLITSFWFSKKSSINIKYFYFINRQDVINLLNLSKTQERK